MFFKLRLNLALKTALLWVVVVRFGFVVGRFGSFWVVPRFSNYDIGHCRNEGEEGVYCAV